MSTTFSIIGKNMFLKIWLNNRKNIEINIKITKFSSCIRLNKTINFLRFLIKPKYAYNFKPRSFYQNLN